MPFRRSQEIYARLRELELPAEAWALMAELHNLNQMVFQEIPGNSRKEAYNEGYAAAETHRKQRDRERKLSRKIQEKPIILLNNNSEGGMGETKKPVSRKPFDALAPVLGAELGRAVVEHRQKLRAPLTLRAAEQLAKRLKSFPDPKAAAEKMLEKGWKSIELEWVNGTGPPKSKGGAVLQFRPEKPLMSNEEWRKLRGEKG